MSLARGRGRGLSKFYMFQRWGPEKGQNNCLDCKCINYLDCKCKMFAIKSVVAQSLSSLCIMSYVFVAFCHLLQYSTAKRRKKIRDNIQKGKVIVALWMKLVTMTLFFVLGRMKGRENQDSWTCRWQLESMQQGEILDEIVLDIKYSCKLYVSCYRSHFPQVLPIVTVG